jgi:hypothetical protein
MRLREIQYPSSVARLLAALVTHAPLIGEDAYELRGAHAVPVALHHLLRHAGKVGRVWCAWTNDRQIWLFTAEMSLSRSRERGSPVLYVTTYGEDGQLQDSGVWTCNRFGKWARCSE